MHNKDKQTKQLIEQKQHIADLGQQLWDLKVLMNELDCENQDQSIKLDEMHNTIVFLRAENQRLKDEITALKGCSSQQG